MVGGGGGGAGGLGHRGSPGPYHSTSNSRDGNGGPGVQFPQFTGTLIGVPSLDPQMDIMVAEAEEELEIIYPTNGSGGDGGAGGGGAGAQKGWSRIRWKHKYWWWSRRTIWWCWWWWQ